MKTLQSLMQEVSGEARMKNTSDFKIVIGADGKKKKVRAHRIKVGDRAPRVGDDPEQDMVTDETSLIKDPPFVLVFKRKAIRPYPGGMKVAMYYNKNLDKYVTVPYGKGMDNPLQAEEFMKTFKEFSEKEMIEEMKVMDHLHDIVKNKQAKRVKFADGSSRTVDHFTASAVTQVHKKVNDANKEKLSNMVHKSPSHLKKAADFAFGQVKRK
tara:strand:- start:3114 stop:3746 length:633 start_codon:yes stop_codon:yes gene_type:complete